ncbi:MAG TPA: EAL domain-containing protein [Roseiarcus sp.]|nr:EAL domain-containing protein [Roseiarcus sp.]
MGYPLDRVELPSGALLFAEGDLGEAAYLIQSGEIEIFVAREGADVILARRGPGDIVGEMAVIVRGKRSAAARTVSDCVLLVVTEPQISGRLEHADPILRMCFRVVADRYLQMASLLRNVNGDNPTARTQPVSLPEFQAAIGALSVEADLRRALQSDELVFYFQPIVRLATQRLAGFEALIRWRHPKRGLVEPDEFIPVVESSGFVVEITKWCLGQAAKIIPQILAAAAPNTTGAEPLYLSINISGHDLLDPSFNARVAETLERSGVPPASLKLEVTESTLLKDPARAADSLKACRELGVEAAIDDFGAGYSSLSYVSKLPMAMLKIAPSFVLSMALDPTTRKIIQLILRLADELGIPVVAEGIEETSEAIALMEMGCAFGQGYLFGRPAPLSQTLDLIRCWTSLNTRLPPRRVPTRRNILASPLPIG